MVVWVIGYFSNDQEAIKWAEEVREALNAAAFADPASEYALTIQRAFTEAGVSADLTTLPQVIQPGQIGILIIDK